jgi:hypothetical protein
MSRLEKLWTCLRVAASAKAGRIFEALADGARKVLIWQACCPGDLPIRI